MKVRNMQSDKTGRAIPNQFIIECEHEEGDICKSVAFQSYNSVIVQYNYFNNGSYEVLLDHDKWDYSTTTGKYRNIFLGETIAETRKHIKSGDYKLVDLN
jgi:hypothetical protein